MCWSPLSPSFSNFPTLFISLLSDESEDKEFTLRVLPQMYLQAHPDPKKERDCYKFSILSSSSGDTLTLFCLYVLLCWLRIKLDKQPEDFCLSTSLARELHACVTVKCLDNIVFQDTENSIFPKDQFSRCVQKNSWQYYIRHHV